MNQVVWPTLGNNCVSWYLEWLLYSITHHKTNVNIHLIIYILRKLVRKGGVDRVLLLQAYNFEMPKPVADLEEVATGAPPPPPPQKKKLSTIFVAPFCIRIFKNKAQIARESIKTPKSLILGHLTGPWKPAVREFGLRARDVRARIIIIFCAP